MDCTKLRLHISFEIERECFAFHFPQRIFYMTVTKQLNETRSLLWHYVSRQYNLF